jgi:DNA polymerase I-like protein with 3'-5' exonuclease and polymerase domains
MRHSFVLEWRTLLYLAQDKIGIQEVIEQQDAHSLNQVAFDLPSRLIAKIYLFRTIYRGSGWSFANDPSFMHVSKSPDFWDEIGYKFYTKYHDIDKCHKEWAETIQRGNPIVGPLGREWTVQLKRDRFGEIRIPWTTLTNYPVQGTGADIMMLARISFANRLARILDTLHGSVILISTVHDSIVCDVEDERDIQAVVNLFHQVFDDIPLNIKRIFGVDWNVPMDCECKIGPDMKNMTKVKRNDK